MELRLPNINGLTPESQLEQLRKYMYQLVGDLNWALTTLETNKGEDGDSITQEDLTSTIRRYEKRMMELIYPVGSIYVSSNDQNPSELIGGTWTLHYSDMDSSIYMWKRTKGGENV